MRVSTRSTRSLSHARRPAILERWGSVVLIAGVLLAACGGSADPGSDEPEPTPIEEPETTLEDEATDIDEPTSPDQVATTGGPLDVVLDAATLSVIRDDGSVLATHTLPEAGSEELPTVFETVAVRPGATATALDAVVASTNGEVPRLHHLQVRDGQSELVLVPDHLQPQDIMEAWVVLAWSPDADSVLWTEPSADGPVLRTFGWDAGPGTGRTADDNATFALDLPMDVAIDGFMIDDDTTWTLLLVGGVGTTHEIAIERQADGALALP